METVEKKDLRSLSEAQLVAYFKDMGEPSFRAKQAYQWLWQKQAKRFEDMTNLPISLREKLSEDFAIYCLGEVSSQVSKDGTIKNAFQLHDQKVIEAVLIPAGERMTACVSSQVGCSLSCAFCATGFMKRMRNLEPGEIVDQVVAIDQQAREHYQQPLSNIVFMGMGEPLLNYKNVRSAIDRITDEKGLGMSAKRITVSTAGVAKMIEKLADERVKFNLALSLHAASDEKRNQIMAINETNNLNALTSALQKFYAATKNRITLEYCVFDQFNDSTSDAEQLVNFAKSVPSKVNLIEYNPVDGSNFSNTSEERLQNFINVISKAGIIVNVRRSRGKDIDAACGQLANKS